MPSAGEFGFLAATLGELLAALPVTLGLFLASIALGGVLAAGLTWVRLRGAPWIARLVRAYVFVFRGSPLLIQMFLVFYGLAQFPAVRHGMLWPVLRNPFACAVIALALCTAAYTAEIFRGALLAVPVQQIEAGRACGMSGWLLLRRIIAPLALRQALPAYSTEIVLMVKSTSLASLVTVWEVTGVALRIISTTYKTLEVFMCAAAIYLLLNFAILRLIAVLEYRLSPQLRAAAPAARRAGAAAP